jgi:hypothetical protein
MGSEHYIDDGGDDSTGTTWATAWDVASDANAVVNAGGLVYIGSTHEETVSGSSKTIDPAAGTKASPVVYITTSDIVNDPPNAGTYQNMTDGGGKIETTGAADDIVVGGNAVYHGLKVLCQDRLNLGSVSDVTKFVDCAFTSVDHPSSAASAEGTLICDDCTFTFPTAGNGFQCAGRSTTRFTGCNFAQVATEAIFRVADSAQVFVQACDLSADDILILSMSVERTQVTIAGCKLHANTLGAGSAPNFNVVASDNINDPESWVQIVGCDDGTSATPFVGPQYFYGFRGYIILDTTEYRTGGASDGDTSYSWKMVSNSNCRSRHQALESWTLTKWVTTSTTALKIYFAHTTEGAGGDSDLQDHELYLKVRLPDVTNNPATSQQEYLTTQPNTSGVADPLKAPADIPNESTDKWVSAPNYQELTVPVAPKVAGIAKIIVCLSPVTAVATVWLDPKVVVVE